MPRNVDARVVPTSDSSQLVFRGQETLEDTMRRYDRSISKMNEFVQSECKTQIQAMERAQADLDARLKAVMARDEMKAMEEETQQHGDKMNTQLRRMHREFQRMEDEIYDDASMDTDERHLKLRTLHQAALDQYGKLSEKYPAAMRAQVLSNIRLLKT